jgi:glycerol dehydrogenase
MEKRHPQRYVQGHGAVAEVVPFLESGSGLVIAGRRAWRAFRGALERGEAPPPEMSEIEFVRHGSRGELIRCLERCGQREYRTVIAAGGGRAIDVGKACAAGADLSCVVIPTVLGTDAACSAVSVLYDDEGAFRSYLDHERNPELVVADLEILAAAPPRYFAAGVVGALAVCFEAEERMAAGGFDGPATLKERFVREARRARARLLEIDPVALRAPARLLRADFEDAVFLSLWVSADLFENVGLSLAHGVYRALRGIGLSTPTGYLHGELVGLGLLCQLLLTETHAEQRRRVTDFVAAALHGTDWSALERSVGSSLPEYRSQLESHSLSAGATSRPSADRIAEVTSEATRLLRSLG